MAKSKVNIGRVMVGGVKRFRVNYRENGKRRRVLCDSLKEAEAEASRIRGEVERVGAVFAGMSAVERSRLADIVGQAENRGIDLRALLAERISNPNTAKRLELLKAVELLESAKREAGKGGDYVYNLALTLRDFAAGRESIAVDAVATEDVESYLRIKAIASRSTLRSRLSTLFRWCVKRGYCQRNPCDGLECVSYSKARPQIFTPKQLESALDWLRLHPRGAVWFVLTTLCGLRPEEAQKTTRDKIHLEAGAIAVDAQTSKVRLRRIVNPLPEVVELLKSVMNWKSKVPSRAMRITRMGKWPSWKTEKPKLPLTRGECRVIRDRLKAHLGLKVWPKDITRHTAASIWLALKPDAAYVAEQLGNSEHILKRDYKVPIMPDDLKRYEAAIRKGISNSNRVDASNNRKGVSRPLKTSQNACHQISQSRALQYPRHQSLEVSSIEREPLPIEATYFAARG